MGNETSTTKPANISVAKTLHIKISLLKHLQNILLESRIYNVVFSSDMQYKERGE
jgi:hypothetical protein